MSPRALVTFSLVVLIAGCGSKTGLGVPDPPDRDAGFDAGFDSGPPPIPDAGTDAGPIIDECVDLPYEEPPTEIFVSFESRISAADVLFLVDTTGSMTEEIDQIASTVRDVLIPSMRETIGDVRFSVASLADFSVGSYGGESDVPFLLIQGSTSDEATIRTAVDRLPMSNGADGPESQTEALYQAATGEGIGRFVPPARCPAEGTVGYPCFRAEGSRIFLLFTDAQFHNGPGGSEAYVGVDPRPHTYAEAVNALRGIGAKVLGLFSGGGDPAALRDLEAVARDTGAVRPGGEPLVFDIGTDGRRLDEGVVTAVESLVEEVPIDIDAIAEDVEGDPFDATMFVTEIQAFRADPPGGAIIHPDRFENVDPGTTVTFRIGLQNDMFPPSTEAQSYLLRVVLRGDGVTRLKTTIVQIVIPGIAGETCEDMGF
jgi:hypothetical protein